jgi:hypothetical protein
MKRMNQCISMTKFSIILLYAYILSSSSMSPYLPSQPSSPLSPISPDFASELSYSLRHTSHQLSSPTMNSNSSNDFQVSRYAQPSYISQSELQQQLTRTQAELGATMYELQRIEKQLDHINKENLCLVRERDTFR